MADDIKAMIGSRPSFFWRAIWYLISPIFLLVSYCLRRLFFFLLNYIIDDILYFDE